MAIKNGKVAAQPQLVKDFWPRFKRGSVFLIMFLQVLILLALALLLNSFGFFNKNPLGAASTLLVQSIVGILSSLVVYHFVARPIKSLLAALVHVAGEPTTETPPNPNEPHFERNGMKPVLQTIYQLASDAQDPLADVTAANNAGAAPAAPATPVSSQPSAVPAASSEPAPASTGPQNMPESIEGPQDILAIEAEPQIAPQPPASESSNNPNAPQAAQLSGTQVHSTPMSPQMRAVLEKALDQTLCGFVVMAPNRTITYANKATPIRISTDGTKSLDLIFNENDTIEKWWQECDQKAVRAEKTWARIPNKLPDSENRRFFDVIASYEKGVESEMVITLIDRTQLYEIGEGELDFIAFAAHELRGPITVIRGYVDVLSNELASILQEDQKELFRRLEVSSSRLTSYINNILNTSRYDRRHLRMHLTETTVKAVYDTISDDMALRASSQNRILTVSIPDTLPTIAADTGSLGEVFGNLIDNAIKYSGEGSAINVSASTRGDTVEIAVEDHGIGMPGNVVSNLFQKFYRSHRSRETVAGTGIGLYISKAVVESHGGTISVRSEDGHGSTFIVSLPTYALVADKLKAGNNENENLISDSGNWIKNHTMYRG